MQEMQARSLGEKEPLDEEMATYSSVPTGRIPWTEEPGGLQSMESQRVGQHLATEQQRPDEEALSTSIISLAPKVRPACRISTPAGEGLESFWKPERSCCGLRRAGRPRGRHPRGIASLPASVQIQFNPLVTPSPRALLLVSS